MSKAKHTKGPWVAVELPTVFAVKSSDGNIASIQRGSNPDQKQANARLIAAAPDLLDALQRLVPVNDIKAAPEAYAQEWHEALAVIDKATGGSA